MKMQQLRKLAEEKVNSRKIGKSCYVASVACALLTDQGNVYLGVCIDSPSSMGFCAEHAAIAQMITNEESRIVKIVAVGEEGKIYPPCGRCRELIYQINLQNIDADILVDENKVVKLEELLPYRWN